MKTESIKHFIRSGTEPFDKGNIFRAMFIVSSVGLLDIFVWWLIDNELRVVRFTFMVLYIFWAIFLFYKNLYGEKSSFYVRFLYNGVAWLFLTFLGLLKIGTIINGSALSSPYTMFFLVLFFAFISYFKIRRCNVRMEVAKVTKASKPTNTIWSTLSGLAGILFMRIFGGFFSPNILSVMMTFVLCFLTIVANLCFTICFYKVYLIRKYNIDED